MCYHRDLLEWESHREEVLDAEPTEPTDEAEPDLVEDREPLAPTADD